MRPHERMLSGYLLARALMGRKIDDAAEYKRLPDGRTLKSPYVLWDLRVANDSLEGTRRLLPNGRGNVKEDILATRGEASWRHLAGFNMATDYRERKGLGDFPKYKTLTRAAANLYTGQATCGGSAIVAAHVHAPKIGKGQAVLAAADVEIDHCWAECMRQNADRHNDQIIDRWTSGPAILREDSSYGMNPKIEVDYYLNPANRNWSTDNLNRFHEEIKKDRNLNRQFRTEMAKMRRAGTQFPGKIWDEENVMSEDFKKQAGSLVHADPYREVHAVKVQEKIKYVPTLPYRQELMAVGVATSLGETVRSAVDKAPGILRSARRMFPEPSAE